MPTYSLPFDSWGGPTPGGPTPQTSFGPSTSIGWGGAAWRWPQLSQMVSAPPAQPGASASTAGPPTQPFPTGVMPVTSGDGTTSPSGVMPTTAGGPSPTGIMPTTLGSPSPTGVMPIASGDVLPTGVGPTAGVSPSGVMPTAMGNTHWFDPAAMMPGFGSHVADYQGGMASHEHFAASLSQWMGGEQSPWWEAIWHPLSTWWHGLGARHWY